MPEQKHLVYIVDDERDVGSLLESALQEAGYATTVFVHGRDLLRELRRKVPDLCIVDLGLPDIDGLDLIKQIRDISHVATIVLTIRSHPSDRILGLELGADDYVVKPFEPRESWRASAACSGAAAWRKNDPPKALRQPPDFPAGSSIPARACCHRRKESVLP